MMDLANIKPSDRTIEILHPATGEPLGVRVSLVSADDERVAKIRRRITDENLRNQSRNKHFKAEDIEQNTQDFLFAAMTKWDWYNPGKSDETMPTFNGEVPEFTKRNVLAIFTALPWFMLQIDEALGDEKAFFGSSKTA